MESKKELKQKIEELEADYRTMEEVAAYLASDCKELYEDNQTLDMIAGNLAQACGEKHVELEKAKREAQFWKRVATRVE